MRVVVAALLSTLVVLGAGQSRAARGAQPQLGFVRGPSVYLASSNGTRIRVVLRGKATSCESECTSGEAYYLDPSWSRNGSVAYVLETYPKGATGWVTDIYVKRAGRAAIRVTTCSENCLNPAIAPDGKRIAFVEYTGCCGGILNMKSVPRGRANPLAGDTTGSEIANDPAWSPDGKRIAFVLGGSRSRLHVIAAGGGITARRLSNVVAHNPSWSPDGRRITFDDGHHVYVIDATGRGLHRLMSGSAGSTDPAWSPAGTTIAFVRGHDVWVVDLAGRHARRVVRNGREPAWKSG